MEGARRVEGIRRVEEVLQAAPLRVKSRKRSKSAEFNRNDRKIVVLQSFPRRDGT